MADAVAGIIQKQISANLPGMEKQNPGQTQTGRSFENILQGGDSMTKTSGTPTAPAAPTIKDDKVLYPMVVDLNGTYRNMPQGVPSSTDLVSGLFEAKTSMSNIKKVLSEVLSGGVNKNQSSGVIGKFTDVENEVHNVNSIMMSDKNLSQGELLGLQARLYQVSQHIDVLSKMVDQMTSGVKTILNTNV